MANVGYATISIVPSFRGAQQIMTGQMTPMAGVAGRAAGTSFGQNVSTSAAGPIRSGFGSLARGIGGIMAAAGAARFISGAVAEAEEAQAVGRQTTAVLQSTGAAAWTSVGQVEALSTALSRKAGIDDELIQSGQNVLLTFTNVQNKVGEGNDIFDRATTAALDMSAALDTDMQSAVMQVGKALNDPIKGLSTLSRAGVQFTQQQKDQVAAMVASGDTLGAQRVIMAELERQFAGSAEANATASERMGVAWANIQEKAGTLLLPVMDRVASVVGTVTDKLSGASPVIQHAAAAVGGLSLGALALATLPISGPVALIVGGIAAVGAAAVLAYKHLTPFRSLVDAIGATAASAWGHFRQMLAGIDWTPVVMGARRLWASVQQLWETLGPLKPLIFAIGGALLLAFGGPVLIIAALAAGIVWAYNEFEGFRNVVQTVFSWWAGTFAPFMLDFWTSVVDGIAGVVVKLQEWWVAAEPVRAAFMQIAALNFQAIVSAITWVIGLVQQWWTFTEPVRSVLFSIANLSFEVLKLAVGSLIALAVLWWQKAEPVRSVLAAIGGFALDTLKSAISTVITNLQTAWEKAEPVRDLLSKIGGMALDALVSAVTTVRDAFESISSTLDSISDKISSLPSLPFGADALFAKGGFLRPGQFGIAGERGPEIIYGGRTGMNVTSTNRTRRLLASSAGFAQPSDGTAPIDPRVLAAAAREGIRDGMRDHFRSMGKDELAVVVADALRSNERGSRYARR